jgi:hypothetical protein
MDRLCLCGKPMILMGEVAGYKHSRCQVLSSMRLWACSPEGCGRIYLEAGSAAPGTWYTAEQNEKRDPF